MERVLRFVRSMALSDSEQQAASAVADAPADVEFRRAPKSNKSKPKRQPRYHVILWDSPDHSFDYVIKMMQKLFGHALVKGFQIAEEVHTQGKAICLTTTLEHAELKRDQIHAFGKDEMIARSKGSMSASIEPEVCG